MDLNRATVLGRLTHDPEVKNTPAGTPFTSFDVATNLVWTDQSGQKQERAEFHHVVAWRKLAGICGQYLKRGSRVLVEGRLQTRNWIGKDDVKRNRTEVVADNMIMLDRAGSSSADGDNPPVPAEVPVIDADNPGEEEVKLEKVPF